MIWWEIEGWGLGLAGGLKGCVYVCVRESERYFGGKGVIKVCVIGGRGRRWVGRKKEI